jgi:hypothetical protein
LGLFLLLGFLALPPEERLGPPLAWFPPPLALLLLAFPGSLDKQWAGRLVVLWLLALLTLLFAVTAPLSSGQQAFLGLLIASTAPVALAQGLGGLASAAGALETLPESLWAPALARLATGRAFGTLPLPGHFAALQALAVPLLRAWWQQLRGWPRFFPAFLLLLSFAATLATRSLLGTFLWVAVFVFSWTFPRGWLGRRPWLWALPLLGLGAVGLLREDLQQLEPLALRWVNWQVAWWSFARWPWLGVGPGGMGLASLTSPWAQENITPFAHSMPLQLLAEFGLAGLALCLLLFAGLLWLVVSLWPAHRPLALALAVGLLHNLADFSFYQLGFLVPYLLLVGTGLSLVLPARFAPVPSWFVFALALPALLLATLEARCLSLAEQARSQKTAEAKVQGLLAAAGWAPWRLSEVLEAASWALSTSPGPVRGQVLEELAKREWVAPLSASAAQARALLLLSLGRRGEAWAWARAAHQRAPHRQELADLEAQCRP